ncbi:protein AAR2 homolog [Dermatophagoides pteronyssinus]|uniref:protein AAR2 homolog n=1 Tax=Dermatophagoides pteronyssinus TaxID=6956 RepID=UPI003F66C06B
MDEIKIPSDNNFDQKTARLLVENYATLIVDQFPEGSEFGIDLFINYTGKNFLGLKMIPPGLHFVHFSLVNNQTRSVAPRIGFFHYFQSKEFYSVRWNSQQEDIDFNVHSDEQRKRFQENFNQGYLDNQLGAYQFDSYQTWVTLTDFITESLFLKMNPECGKIYSASNLVYKTLNTTATTTDTANSESIESKNHRHCPVDHQGLPDMIISPECAIRFPSAPLPKHFLYPEGSRPTEITEHSLDSSYTLEFLIREKHQTNQFDLFGELQFAFIVFLFGHQYESFEHWEQLIRVICSCRKALIEKLEFFLTFIRVLYFELKQIDQQIFADIVTNENRIYYSLQTFFLNIHSMKNMIQPNLLERVENFRKFLSKTLRWNFGKQNNNQEDLQDDDDENIPEDEKPVVVLM